ncbi:protein MODIFYING WALL LIGNIN-2-like isoform X3 [Primulina tabacum]|uniref:protein MODIFYING WALL LIGNIN-2-like isoform X3 n=1 Tax=Primulina tabacum TaxID=48773 RepID=UPI003F5972B3
MERLNSHSFVLFSCVTVAFGLVSFTLCLAAEFKKSKKEDLRLEGKLCYLPRSAGVELGVMGLIFLVATQVTANLLLISRKFCSAEDITSCKLRMPILSCALLILSCAATSMSRSQQLGQGWLDGKCYLVKDGVYLGSAMLVLMALGSTLSSAAIVVRHRQAEENRKVHAGVQE